jgi:hypothetical protein
MDGRTLCFKVEPGVPMNAERTLIVSIVFLILGLGLIFGYSHGTVSFSAAYPISGTALQVDLKTMGVPAIAGLAATLLGTILLIVAAVQAIVAQWPLSQSATRGSSPIA